MMMCIADCVLLLVMMCIADCDDVYVYCIAACDDVYC